MASTQSPLTPDDFAKLKQAESALMGLIPSVDRLKACGIECDHYRQMIELASQQSAQMRSVLFNPDGTPKPF